MQFSISTFMQFTYEAQLPGCIVARNFIDSMITHTFQLSQPGNPVPVLATSLAYPAGYVPMKLATLSDIKKLFRYIPEEYKEFYQEVCDLPVREQVED
ncbi:hypothetical protein ANN_00856 [Periplaneta americana]|uniref:Per a allergen n=1 Tax=Periplaneta americana TaxID=6978 RepID=A0ABQ8TS01_PERAM|nr:hypothetical protein ANN_00856 [Periplaneta americana]